VAGAWVVQIALDDWLSSARLPRALKSAGLEVVALCGSASPLRLTRHISSQIILDEATELVEQLERIVEDYSPIAVIPSDEQTVRHLHAIVTTGSGSLRLLELLRRSLGDSHSYETVSSKWATAELARRLDILVPRQSLVRTVAEAIAFARDVGFPIILKREDTYGGMGCIVCRSEGQTWRAIARLRFGPLLHRRMRSRRTAGAWEVALHSREAFIVQRYQEGPLAFSACVASNGRMISGLTVIAERVNPAPTGASTVVRALERPDLLEISAKLIEATGCSGFIGFDFILDGKTDQPYLLEINPRVTPLCQVSGLLGTDLCAAFAESFAGIPARTPTRRTTDCVAFFPDEWLRDPASAYFKTAYHDIPVDDESLIALAETRLRLRQRMSHWFNSACRRMRRPFARTLNAPMPFPGLLRSLPQKSSLRTDE
jgi:glutathione synthase/RimK-type ligase-like ATP-grasp enzyme